MIRILVADDHVVVRNGVRQMLESCSDIVVQAEASTVAETLAMTSATTFDVVLLDLELPDGQGMDVLRELQRRPESPRVVIFTFHDDQAEAALAAGATGYLSKDVDAIELQQAIRTASLGELFVGARIRERNLQGHSPLTVADPLRKLLSPREREVFERFLAGRRAKEIAFELQISEKTVATHRARMLKKLGLDGSHDLFLYGVREGLMAVHA